MGSGLFFVSAFNVVDGNGYCYHHERNKNGMHKHLPQLLLRFFFGRHLIVLLGIMGRPLR